MLQKRIQLKGKPPMHENLKMMENKMEYINITIWAQKQLPERLNLKAHYSSRFGLHISMILDSKCQMIVDKKLFFLALHIQIK